jgi:hypothetical protein
MQGIRCEAVVYITRLTAEETTPQDLLARVRGHWRIEHTHWPRGSPRCAQDSRHALQLLDLACLSPG